MTTLVTGATGFVGSAVVRLLLEAGHTVRVLVRPGADCSNIAGLDVEQTYGDLLAPDTLMRALRSCDTLVHAAADYRLWTPEPQLMYRTNVQGTRDLMQAALAAGAARIVYTSSVAALGLRKDGLAADEQTPACLEDRIGHYKRSKFLAEQEVSRLVREEQLPAVIVNPSTPMGPRDIKPTPTGQIILDTMQGRMPAYVDTGLNVVHVDDAARGHLLALDKGRIGERYILGGDNVSLRAILQQVCAVTGQRPPWLRLPHKLVLPIAWCMERLGAITGQAPRTTVDAVRMARHPMYFSSARAERELGYRHRPAADAIRDAVHWFMERQAR